MVKLIAADIGGTHARFAIAEVAGGRVVSLGDVVTLKTADYDSLPLAWKVFTAGQHGPLPRAAAIAVAAPVGGDVVRLSNNLWTIHPASTAEQLHIDCYTLINDFGAVGHCVAQVPDSNLVHLCGPDRALPEAGMTTVCGPGTGLGVAAVLRHAGGYHILETEGGHIDFAPLDTTEDALLGHLRTRFDRVSVERVVAGPGIVAIYRTLAADEGHPVEQLDDTTIWARALDGSDSIASNALDRFCRILGAVTGDLALAHGSTGVVIAGGLGLRLGSHLPHSGFAERFVAKGRFRDRMADIPVKLITHPQPGLYGAAAAFAQEHPE